MIGDIIIMVVAGLIVYGSYKVYKNDKRNRQIRENRKSRDELWRNHRNGQ